MEKSIGKRIAAHRKNKGLTQEQLAELLNVTPQAVSKWENDLSCPDVMTLPRLSEALGVSIDELLKGEVEKSRETTNDNDKPAEKTAAAKNESKAPSPDELMLVIKVDCNDGDKVRVRVPVTLIRVIVNAGISPEVMGGERLKNASVDWATVINMVESGAMGKLIEVDTDEEHIEIVVE